MNSRTFKVNALEISYCSNDYDESNKTNKHSVLLFQSLLSVNLTKIRFRIFCKWNVFFIACFK